jgi:hypothetical protein
MALVVTVAVALVVVGLAVWAARDMDRLGHRGEAYALAVLFLPPVGLVLWAHDRRRSPR